MGELPPDFGNPTWPWLVEDGSGIVFACFVAYFACESIRARTLTFGTLLLISSTTMWWQEFYGDWGAYLLYNPKFMLIPWGTTLWTTPNKPWFVVVAYGWYFTSLNLAILWMSERLRAHRPGLGHLTAVVIVAAPVFYLWDLVVEGGAALAGWWTYVCHYGPTVVASKGSFPLVYPILSFTVYGVIVALILSCRGDDGRVQFESRFALGRIRDKFSRELARVGIWILVMNGLFLVLGVIPWIVVRELFGVPSVYVP